MHKAFCKYPVGGVGGVFEDALTEKRRLYMGHCYVDTELFTIYINKPAFCGNSNMFLLLRRWRCPYGFFPNSLHDDIICQILNHFR